MKFTTTRHRLCDLGLAEMFLAAGGFIKSGKEWSSGNRWAVIERHVNGKDFVVQVGGVC